MSSQPDVVDVHLIHSLVGRTDRAREVASELLNAGRIVEVDESHYRLIDVPNPQVDDQSGAMDVFLAWHLKRVRMADKIAQPFSRRISSGEDMQEQHFESATHAVDWFRSNADLLMSVLKAAPSEGWHDLVLSLAEPVWSLCRLTGRHEDELTTQTLSIKAIEHLVDDQQVIRRAVCHARKASALSNLRRHSEAIAEADQAVELANQAGSDRLLSTALSASGRALAFSGDAKAAVWRYKQALALAEQDGDTRSVALRYRRLGEALLQLGDVDAALVHVRKSAHLMDLIDDGLGVARALTVLSRALLKGGEYAEAFETMSSVLETLERSGCSFYEAEALELIAEAAEALQKPDANVYYVRAIARFDESYEPTRAERIRCHVAAEGPDLPD